MPDLREILVSVDLTKYRDAEAAADAVIEILANREKADTRDRAELEADTRAEHEAMWG